MSARIQLHYIRQRLITILLFYAKPAPAERINARRTRELEFNVNKPTARKLELNGKQLTIPTQPIHFSETRSYKSGNELISENLFRNLRWSRATRDLSEIELAWLHYCYGEKQTDFNSQRILCEKIWQRLLNDSSLPKMSKKTYNIFKSLTFLALQNTRHFIVSDFERHQYSAKDLAKLSQKSLSSWLKDYHSRWLLLINYFIELDEEILKKIEISYRFRKFEEKNNV